MGQYSIKDVEVLTGVKAHTLRIWEQRYKLFKAKRTDTNIRYYTDDQLRLLLNIGTLNRNGMKISKIARLSSNELNERVIETYHAPAPQNLIDGLIHAMLDFDERKFEKTLLNAIMKMGFEDAFTELVFPFLTRTGVLWAAGAVKVIQEHFITNLLRRKIMAAIDTLDVQPGPKSKRFVLFLPEGETHELLLLFTEYILKKHNHEVVYAGASLPVNDLLHIYKSYAPHYFVTIITSPLPDQTATTFLKKLSASFPRCGIIAGGMQLKTVNGRLPANCTAIHSRKDLLQAIA